MRRYRRSTMLKLALAAAIGFMIYHRYSSPRSALKPTPIPAAETRR